MGFAEAVNTVLKEKYADFSGRARRSEYWFWYLAVILGYVVCLIVTAIVKPLGFLLLAALILGAIVPTLAVSVRRLHDTGKSGWMLLLGLIPLVGGIILLVFYVMDSDPAPNQYGPSPKGGLDAGGYPPPPPGYGTPPTA